MEKPFKNLIFDICMWELKGKWPWNFLVSKTGALQSLFKCWQSIDLDPYYGKVTSILKWFYMGKRRFLIRANSYQSVLWSSLICIMAVRKNKPLILGCHGHRMHSEGSDQPVLLQSSCEPSWAQVLKHTLSADLLIFHLFLCHPDIYRRWLWWCGNVGWWPRGP